jgi:glycosyltransferase involved in cell wall biosynthesis
MKKVAIIGSHGLYAKYGGWDQLVNNLAENKSENIEYLIFNSSNTKFVKHPPEGVIVNKLIFKADGFQGFFFDFQSILMSYFKSDTLLLLGAQGMPIVPFLSLFKKTKIIVNIGGIEWERPKYNILIKKYFRYCFKLSCKKDRFVILDNEYYKKFIPNLSECTFTVLPYGGEIDQSLSVNQEFIDKYKFIKNDYFLSISRSLMDNNIDELCNCFLKSDKNLVLISNLSNSEYGKNILKKYSNHKNIHLIDGLYDKKELDLIRRKCVAYIHTHTLCGTAPSLVEMIVSERPILSIDVPQNRFTLNNQGFFYKNFEELASLIMSKNDYNRFIPKEELKKRYAWKTIVKQYESLF